MTTTTKAGGAVLPVVGWRPRVKCVPEQNFNAGSPKPADVDYWKAINCGIEYACDRDIAQATIDELRAEVERLTREKAAIDELWSVTLAQLAEAVRRLDAKQIDVDAVMRLADEWVVEAIHAALAANSGHTSLADPDAAREALRAEITKDRALAGGTKEE